MPLDQRFRQLRRRRRLALAGCLLLLLQPPADAAGRAVSFRAADGRVITALLMEASRRPAPAVVLVPMLGRGKEDWQSVGQRLADADITALAIDLPDATLPEDPAAVAAWQADVKAALDYLGSRPDVRALGAAGASLGGSLAALAAATDGRVRSLALISPSLDYRGIRIETAMRQYGERPCLLVASLRDPYAARTVRDLSKEPPGIREARWADAAAHGMILLSREPDLIRALVEWFQRTL